MKKAKRRLFEEGEREKNEGGFVKKQMAKKKDTRSKYFEDDQMATL